MLAQPLTLSTAAWRAIGTQVVEPAGEPGLLRAWREASDEGGTTTVFLTAQDAAALARLLDARPELAAALGG